MPVNAVFSFQRGLDAAEFLPENRAGFPIETPALRDQIINDVIPRFCTIA